MESPEEWPDITAVAFATKEDAHRMAEILNDMILKIKTLRTELLSLHEQVNGNSGFQSCRYGIHKDTDCTCI